jgi:hypothetical protein
MLLTERQVDLRLKCPMFGMEDMHGPSSYECAQKLLRWAALNAFKGRLVPVATLRGKFESIWNGHTAVWAPDHQPAYYAGLRAGNTAARKIFLFLQHYEVLKPVEAYSADLAGDRVEGEYAVVLRRHDRRTDERPMILQAHEWRPAYCQQPGAVELIRYVHLMGATDYTSPGVYHLPLFRGEPWKMRDIDLPLVRKAVASILNAVRNTDHPVPGSHCEDCSGKSCRSLAHA